MPSFSLLICVLAVAGRAGAERPILPLWPNTPPDETKKLPPEADTTKPTDKKIADRPVMRIGNVSTPTLTIYRPEPQRDTGAAVIVCPGGGHRILAWDLEGTEVAEWLNSIGVTAFVLKYRVPARHEDRRWLSAVQDAQRAVGVVRAKADEWKIDPKRLGILGFSAGGETAALTALLTERLYQPVDAADKFPSRPDFVVLVYAGGLIDPKTNKLRETIQVTETTPPIFFAHAADDSVSAQNSLLLAAELVRVKVPAEVHIYSTGGHGFGLRRTDEPCSTWPQRCEDWLKRRGILTPRAEKKPTNGANP